LHSIPTSIRNTQHVAHAIAAVARQRGDLASSVQWLETALQGPDKSKKKDPDLRAELAATLLELLMNKYEVVNRTQLIPEDKKKIKEAIDLLSRAINDVSESETIN